MARPARGSDVPPSPRRGSLLRTVRAVAWSFFGVRKSRDLERDVSELKPLHVIVVGVAGSAACLGSAGTLPPTSKKVYERVMVLTSFGSFASTTNTTGHCFVSPGLSRCSLKQKHSSLLKYDIATEGA